MGAIMIERLKSVNIGSVCTALYAAEVAELVMAVNFPRMATLTGVQVM